MNAIGYIAGLFAMAMVLGAVVIWASRRRSRETRNDDRHYPHGGEMDDLNRLLEEGAISPEEYELIRRRILAGRVF